MIQCILRFVVVLCWTMVGCSPFLFKTTPQMTYFRRIPKQTTDSIDVHPHLLYQPLQFASGRKNGRRANLRAKMQAIKRWMIRVCGSTPKSQIRFVVAQKKIRWLLFVSSYQKKRCSGIAILAIALAGFFVPAVPPANAQDFSEVPLVSMTRITRETTKGTAEESKLRKDPTDRVCELETDISEVEIIQHVIDHSSTLSGGDTDAWRPRKTRLPPSETLKKSSRLVSHCARVVAGVVATGGCVFLASKKFPTNEKDNQDDVVERSNGAYIQLQDTSRNSVTDEASSIPSNDPVHVKARHQPKTPEEEAELAARYAKISDVGERAFQILVDLGMIELNR